MRTRSRGGTVSVYLNGVLLLLLAAGMALAPRVAWAETLVVEDDDPSVVAAGDWTATSLTTGYSGAGYRFHLGGDGGGTITWPFPAQAPAGQYTVSVRWTSGPNRASRAPYTVTHADGAAQVEMNQRTGGGAWRSLGTFTFAPNGGQAVALSNLADGVVIADAVRWVGPLGEDAVASVADEAAEEPVAEEPLLPRWAVTFRATGIHAGPDTTADRLGVLPQFSYLEVRQYVGDWAYVYNPRARGTGYVRSDMLGPSEAPPAYVTAEAPPALDVINRIARTVGEAPLAYYPVADKWVYEKRLGHNALVLLKETVRGLDGQTWYRTADGGYLQSRSVRLPPPPPRTFPGRWIDVSLTEPVIVTAYDGDQPVHTTLAVYGTGRWQTPMGVFSIQRRVANETMNSETIGIPRGAPGGYYLQNVLYTQYFLPSGEALHYNYWSSNWGYAGSRGCLGLSREDAEFFWNWATIGTPLSIHS